MSTPDSNITQLFENYHQLAKSAVAIIKRKQFAEMMKIQLQDVVVQESELELDGCNTAAFATCLFFGGEEAVLKIYKNRTVSEHLMFAGPGLPAELIGRVCANAIVGIKQACEENKIVAVSLYSTNSMDCLYDHTFIIRNSHMIDAFTKHREIRCKKLEDSFIDTLDKFVKLPKKWGKQHIDTFESLFDVKLDIEMDQFVPMITYITL